MRSQPEHLHRRHRLTPLAQAIAMAGLLAAPLWLQAQTLPGGLQVVQGQASVATVGTQMTVNNSAGAILNWQTFSIGAANGVHFQQATAASKVLNRVVGHDPSAIFGSLTSNGQVWLLNPNGVLFGAGARVDVAGLVASTLRLNDNDFLAGRYRFSADTGDRAGVRNEGALASSFGGHIVLLGESVENAGGISAPGGSVSLAAARSVELVDTGLPNLAVKVSVPAGEVLNLGALAAAGGTVDVYAGIVNQQGLVQADTLGADAQGRIVLHAADTLALGAASVTRAVGSDAAAAGGSVDLLGAQVSVLGRALVDVSGTAGGGAIRLGGGEQGRDRSVPNARAVWFGPEAVLRADATGDVGSGGRIVLWSDAATRAYGSLSARGGAVAGDGGFIETSGGWLDARPAAVDLAAPGGRAGSWLLDPNNITINDAGPDTSISPGPVFTSTNDNSVISTATIAAALNAGTSVTVATGTGGSNSQSGDILMDAATLNVAPPAAVTLTLQAARDIVVRNSTVASTGQALSLDLVAAGSGVGAVEIIGSTLTTAGGSITLGGAIAQQLPTPGGFTSATYRPAVGYQVVSGVPSITSSGGNVGAAVYDSALNLGSGNFSATGLTTVDGSDAVGIGTAAGTTVINAGRIDLVGAASVPSPSGTDAGVFVRGNSTDLNATLGIGIEGYGRLGAGIFDGARVALNAGAGSGAVFRILGQASDDAGVALVSDDFSAGTGGRGTRLTLSNAALDVIGTSQSNYAVVMFNNSLVPGLLLDLGAATGASVQALTGFGVSLLMTDVELKLPTGGSTLFQGNNILSMTATSIEGNGGSVSFQGSGHRFNASNIVSTGAAMAVDFATTGAAPSGVLLENSIIQTAGGDLRFGAVQNVSSSVLGATTVAAPWVETADSYANYSGSSVPAALWVVGSTLDAGTGQVSGGGAARTASVGAAGVTLDGSIVTAREIKLAGRSEGESGINVLGGSYTASRVFAFDSLSSPDGFFGTFIGAGSALRLIDPTASAGSGMSLQATHLGAAVALGIEGGDVGTANETVITVDGGSLALSGTTAGGIGSGGVLLAGTVAAPGGLLVNALGATDVAITAVNAGNAGASLTLARMNLLGPQNSAASQLDITASGGARSAPGATLNDVTLSSAGAVRVVADGLAVSDSRLGGEAGLALLGNTGASAGAPVSVTNSTLNADGAGAVLRIDASTGGAGTRGLAGYNAGQGVTVTSSTLTAAGSAGAIVLGGRGADTGGDGVMLEGSQLRATQVTVAGTGVVDGHGIVVRQASNVASNIDTVGLDLTGVGADSAAGGTHVGVFLQDFTGLHFTGRGVANITGSSASLDGTTVPGGTVLVDGDAAEFNVRVDRSMRLRDTLLDFSAGAGTAIVLQGDANTDLIGRVRLDNTTVRTGGGSFSAAGVGVHSFDVAGNPLPANTTLGEGATGVLLSTASIDAAGGAVSLTGRAATDGRTPLPTDGGAWGITASGTNNIAAGSIVLSGHGGDKGTGIDIGVLTASAVLDLQAGAINVQGTGIGLDPNTATPLPGVALASASTWTVTGVGVLSVDALASPLQLAGLTATAGNIGLNAGGALTLQGSTLTSSGDLGGTATGSPINGSLFSIDSSTLAAGGNLALSATSSGPGVALMLLSSVALSGADVALSGLAVDGVGIYGQAFSGSIVATAGNLRLLGRDAAAASGGIALEGGWVLQAPLEVALTASPDLRLGTYLSGPQTPVFQAGSRVAVELDVGSGTALLGGPTSSLDTAVLTSAVAGLAATSEVRIRVPAPGAMSVDSALAVPGRLRLKAETLTLEPGALLTANGAGDAIVLEGAASPIVNFTNNAGAGVLDTPNGRWVLDLSSPATSVLGGLGGDFTAYNLAAAPWAVDANGNFITPSSGNAVAYAVAPAALAGTSLAGLLDKVYDATTAITLDPLAWTINGLLAGDTLALSGANTATMADKNVGTGKAVALNPASVFTITDGSGNPVFGYDPPVFTATVTPAPLLLAGTAVANKVYDASVAATLASPGSFVPLGADVVALGAATASFADKNVGSAKPVLLSGLTLVGADAGNYTLVPPTGLVADITPLALAPTGLTVSNKVYDATTAATLNGTAAIGVLAGDSALLAGSATASFSDKNVGAAKAVAVAGLSLAGTDAGNYTLAQPAGLVADITPLSLALTGLSAADKVYDAGTAATLVGTAGINPLAGDTVTLAGTGLGSFVDKNVGVAKAVSISGLTLAGADAGNYQLVPPAGVNASITPATATVGLVSAVDKVYDGSTVATATAPLAGVLGGDAVTLGLAAAFSDANVGTAKAVTYTATIAGADSANYTLNVPTGGPAPTASITPATLTYLANALTVPVGNALPLLTGSVTGFVGAETLASATTGTLAFTSPATAGSPAGSYAITGSGLSALNYLFVQAPGNATALTLAAQAGEAPATVANLVSLTLALQSVQVGMAMSSPTEGRVLDVTPAFALGADGGDGGGLSFRAVNFSLMPRDEVQSLLAARASYKKKVFAGSLSKLELDPALADVPACKTEAELSTGNCLITEALKKEIETIAARAVARPRPADRRKVRQAVLPVIERKLALLIGVNKYDDKRVPELVGAVPDARAVRSLLESRLGYETTVIENPKRETIIRAFNKLALEARPADSVVIYYAGHGEVVPVNGVDVGYWLPADVNPEEPKTWLANGDIARMVAAVGAGQLMLISDSCYSGTLAGAEKVQLAQRTDAADLLKRKAAVVLSSGGNEPVADEGRDGHSVFAWHLMRALEGLEQWQVGTNVFERVRAAVVKEFPQTPQYGASRTAGHEGNTDYLFERREFEAAAQPAGAPRAPTTVPPARP